MNLSLFKRIQIFGELTSADIVRMKEADKRVQTYPEPQRTSLDKMLKSPPSNIGKLIMAENFVKYGPVEVDDYYWKTLFQPCEFGARDSASRY